MFDNQNPLGRMTNMNEQLRRMFGPQFLQNLMKQMPMQELDRLQNLPEWGQVFGGDGIRDEAAGNSSGFPRVDIYQTRQEVVVVAELPGLLSEKDVKVQIKPTSITLSGNSEGRFASFKEERFLVSERFRGSFERTLTLPVRVRPTQSRASYKNGLLEVRILKDQRKSAAPKAQGHQVPVSFT